MIGHTPLLDALMYLGMLTLAFGVWFVWWALRMATR